MTRMLPRRAFGIMLGSIVVSPFAGPAMAQGLPAPKGPVILTISGRIRVFNSADAALFDRDMLEALGTASFRTMTPWYDHVVEFEGVRMDRLMETVGAAGTMVIATSLNDYITEIPISDFARFGTIIALKRNGSYMPVRDKGPLWIVYPFDSDEALGRPPYTSRSAWQVRQLMIK